MQIGVVELIGFAITLIGAFWALLSMLFKQSQDQIAEKFIGLEKSTSEKFLTLENSTAEKFASLEELAKELARVEKEFLIFQRDLSMNYVRREDYIRNHTVFESKLDALAKMLQDWHKEVYTHER